MMIDRLKADIADARQALERLDKLLDGLAAPAKSTPAAQAIILLAQFQLKIGKLLTDRRWGPEKCQPLSKKDGKA
jgi:hypothetical protein